MATATEESDDKLIGAIVDDRPNFPRRSKLSAEKGGSAFVLPVGSCRVSNLISLHLSADGGVTAL
jgi:hypothetical protein